jgi:DNA-binding NarL/FixJ family response regulator
MGNVRTLIIANDPLLRAGLSAMLAGASDVIIAGQLAPNKDLVKQAQVYQPDAVLWDLAWNPSAVLVELAEIVEAVAGVVALAPDERVAGEVWAAGVRGVLLREATSEALAAALQAIAHGLIVLDPALAGVLVAPSHGTLLGDGDSIIEALTPRELEVLRGLAEGLPNKQIARRLEISEHTVKFHVNAILGKLGAQSRTEAVVRATRAGLILL